MDTAQLLSLIVQLQVELAAQQHASQQLVNQLAEQQQTNQQLVNQLASMQARLDELLRILYGQRSEKNRKPKPEPDDPHSPQPNSPTNTRTPSAHPGRHKLPEDLPRTVVKHELTGDDLRCRHCESTLHVIGKSVSEQLGVIPAKFYVIEHRRYKYACRHRCTIKTASMPNQPVDKGIASADLLAHITLDKYQDHCPLHRQALKFHRQAIHLAESTLCDWVAATATLLEPLVHRLYHKMIDQSSHIFTDDTSIPVLAKGKTQTARLWVYCALEPRIVLYQYTANRRGQHPQRYLADFKGYLQADAYSGYDRLYEDNTIIEVGCMAHARRHFVDITKAVKGETLAQEAVELIGQLYDIEHYCKSMTPTQRQYYRKRYSKPILRRFRHWLRQTAPTTVPKAPLGKAIGYCLNHWVALTRYLADGRLLIDNNTAERCIKPVVIGRKNYLFAGSHDGGRRAAIIYSIIETCKANGINTFLYLKWVLSKIPNHLNKHIDELLPCYVTPAMFDSV